MKKKSPLTKILLFGGIGLLLIAVIVYVIFFLSDPEPQQAIAMRAAAAFL